MSRLLLVLFGFGAVLMLLNTVLKAAGIAILAVVAIYIAVLLVGLLYVIARSIYHAFSPSAKQRFISDKLKKEAEAKVTEQQKAATIAQAEKLAHDARQARELQQAELLRDRLLRRDADTQREPYIYTVGRHANEALAIRYGIANEQRAVKKYFYFARGGEKRRNPERDTTDFQPASEIRLKKLRRINHDVYEVALTDFRDRRAKAVIEKGTDYVKTFLPIDDAWFDQHANLEETLKGNGSFSLKELATFHVQKAVR